MPPRASSRSTSYSPANTRRTRSSRSSCPSAATITVSAWGSDARTPQFGQYRVSSSSSVPQRKQRIIQPRSWMDAHALCDGGQGVGENRIQQDGGDGVEALRQGDER